MRFQLNIRHNLRLVADPFASSAVRTFAQENVRVGRGEQCECRLDEPGLSDVHFRIAQDAGGAEMTLFPEPGAELFLNQERVESPRVLRSGDEIRVGHWTFGFFKAYAAARHSHRCELLATIAKVLVALILLAEIAVVVLLPRRLRSERVWEEQIARQRTLLLLDRLRSEVPGAAPAGSLEASARKLTGEELDAVARYLREFEGQLQPKQWRQVYEDLAAYGATIARLAEGHLVQPIPDLDDDAAVRAVLASVKEKGAAQ